MFITSVNVLETREQTGVQRSFDEIGFELTVSVFRTETVGLSGGAQEAGFDGEVQRRKFALLRICEVEIEATEVVPSHLSYQSAEP